MSLLSVDDAQARVLQGLTPLEATLAETHEAIGRVLSSDITATRTIPAHNNSAMDGFALRAADVVKPGATLAIIETIHAGRAPSRRVEPGQCARIMTGAPLPDGADAVVMQEQTERAGADAAQVTINATATVGLNVRLAGEDARAGTVLLPAGTAVGIPEAGLLWAQGLRQVHTFRRPTVAIASSGDELCTLDEVRPDKIVDTNSLSIAAAVRRAGGVPRILGIAPDNADALTQLVKAGLEADVLITSAGVSVGEHDFTKEAFTRAGVTIDFWKLAMRPGKPLAFGARGRTLVFGLPGNPTSSLVSFELFVRPALLRLQGHSRLFPQPTTAKLKVGQRKKAGLRHFVRVQLELSGEDTWAVPLGTQTSGAVRSAAGATHLAVLPETAEDLAPGAAVSVIPVSWTGA